MNYLNLKTIHDQIFKLIEKQCINILEQSQVHGVVAMDKAKNKLSEQFLSHPFEEHEKAKQRYNTVID